MTNTRKYYLIPLEEVSDKMIEDAILTSRETLRTSVRPIDGKIHAVIKFTGSKPVPAYMSKYKQFDHKEILEAIRTPEWNLSQPIHDLQKRYDFTKILHDFEAGNCIQSFGEMYITIFQILKFKFFTHSKKYLNSPSKWKVFKERQFEDANEYAMLQFNFFYDLISEDEKNIIDRFRIKRNAMAHSFDHNYDKVELKSSLEELDEIVTKYITEL